MDFNSLTAVLMIRDAKHHQQVVEEIFKVWSHITQMAEEIKEVPSEYVDYVDYVYDQTTMMTKISKQLDEILAASQDYRLGVAAALDLVKEKSS